MLYLPDIMEQLSILCRFNLGTTQEGIKVYPRGCFGSRFS